MWRAALSQRMPQPPSKAGVTRMQEHLSLGPLKLSPVWPHLSPAATFQAASEGKDSTIKAELEALEGLTVQGPPGERDLSTHSPLRKHRLDYNSWCLWMEEEKSPLFRAFFLVYVFLKQKNHSFQNRTLENGTWGARLRGARRVEVPGHICLSASLPSSFPGF